MFHVLNTLVQYSTNTGIFVERQMAAPIFTVLPDEDNKPVIVATKGHFEFRQNNGTPVKINANDSNVSISPILLAELLANARGAFPFGYKPQGAETAVPALAVWLKPEDAKTIGVESSAVYTFRGEGMNTRHERAFAGSIVVEIPALIHALSQAMILPKMAEIHLDHGYRAHEYAVRHRDVVACVAHVREHGPVAREYRADGTRPARVAPVFWNIDEERRLVEASARMELEAQANDEYDLFL